MRRFPALAVLALLLACPPARGDITLNGTQHIGDCKPKGASCAAFTQNDPVTRDFMFSKPINFHVSTLVMLDKVRLNNPEDLGNQLQIYLELQGASFTSSRFGVLSGDTFDLIPDIPLLPDSYYFLLPDGGCTVNNNESSPNGFYEECDGGEDNDIGFSSITLITNPTTATGTSVMFNRRRHIGDSNEGGGNVGYAGRWYPDDPDALTVDLSFTLGANSRLDSVEFFRLRDVGAGLQRATVRVDGSSIGTLTENSNPADAAYPVDTGLLLLTGSHTLRIQMPDPGDADDISWDDIVLRFVDTTTSGTVGFFNAVDVGDNALTGKLRTKVAGGAFTLDLYAMNGFGTGTNPTYNGNATVEVLDASVTTGSQDIYGCHASWTVAQSLPDVTFSAGKATVSDTFLNAGLKNARIRVTDSTTQARGCSLDNFAIRPNSFSVVPSHDTETTAGTAVALTNTALTGLPRHKAGSPFTITATATGANSTTTTSYDGTPEISRAVLAPATVVGTITTGNWASAGAGIRRAEGTYSEVGAVTLTVKDTTWANVDTGDTAELDRTITGTVNAGRFIPDHFNVAEGTLAPKCVGGFTYLGDTLAWATTYAARLTAVNAGNQTTQNYATSTGFESLPATLASAPTYAANAGTIGEAVAATPTIGDAVAGVATIVLPALKFTRERIAAFNAEIQVTLPAFTDGDTVAPNDLVLGATTTGNGVAFTGNAKSQRFGRLYFEPTYGSERLPMQVPLRAEYYDGTAFVANAQEDNLCTTITTGTVTFAPLVVGQTHAVSGGNGAWTVTLDAPNQSGTAGLSIPAASFPLLAADDADVDDVYDDDPATTVTFGLYSQDQRRIFQHEMVGN